MTQVTSTTPTKDNPNYFLQNLEENPGLYFEKLPDLRFTEANWNIIIFMDFKNLKFNYSYFKNATNEIRFSCPTDYPGQCKSILTVVDYTDEKINRTQNMFLD